jgi:prevent-host-death family protein
MPKIVSSTEAQNHFAAMMAWAADHKEGVIVEVRGHPKAVILSHTEYTELLELRRLEQQRQALAALKALREAVQSNMERPLTALEAYLEAGISPEIAQTLVENDEKLVQPT